MKYPRNIKVTVGGVEIVGMASGAAFEVTPRPGCWARCNVWGGGGVAVGWAGHLPWRDDQNSSMGAIELCSGAVVR